jgi:hypothetical protein
MSEKINGVDDLNLTLSGTYKLQPPTLEEQARAFCIHAGWHHNGDTKVMLYSGGFIELAEVMADFVRQIAAERDQWRGIAEDLQKTQSPQIVFAGGLNRG